jgi:3-phenylpropionate/cinnamic acid dioxygenase small subunit
MSDSAEQIHRLMYEYAECVDLARFDALGELFAHGQIASQNRPGEVIRGARAVRDFYAAVNRVHPGGTLCTRHLCTNIILDVDEQAGTASARSYFVVLQATDKLPFQPIAGGRYHDRFERVDGRWHFAERFIYLDQIGDVSEHLMLDLGAESGSR